MTTPDLAELHWPAHTWRWFGDLEANNDKAWYDANKQDYRAIEDATRDLFETLAADLGGGSVKIFRLRRDARFSKGQPPYKTEQRAGIMRPDGVVWSFDLGPTGIAVSSGHPLWDKGQLARARQALADPVAVTDLIDALDEVCAAGFDLDEPELKRPLKDLPVEHPQPELTRHKHLSLHRFHDAGDWLFEHGAALRLIDDWQATNPVGAWLAAHVGTSEA